MHFGANGKNLKEIRIYSWMLSGPWRNDKIEGSQENWNALQTECYVETETERGEMTRKFDSNKLTHFS